MHEIVWSVNPSNDNLHAIVQHLHKLAADILAPSHTAFVFIDHLSTPEKELSPQTRKDFILLFKEAVNNARKYSNANQIDISIHQDDDILSLEIKDNGQGFDWETVCKGNGLNNMQRRAKDMNATLSLFTQKEQGTKVYLVLPIP